MNCSILVAFNDSASSRSALEHLIRFCERPEQSRITLLHVFRRPTGSEEMMGKKFMQSATVRIQEAMEAARSRLIAAGFTPSQITLQIVEKAQIDMRLPDRLIVRERANTDNDRSSAQHET